jgi:pimeloyl-ACP methyl ester carboxylesterase
MTGRPFTFEHSTDDIATALERLDIPHADVLGFSIGGIVSMRLAARHPSVVRRLIA